MRFNSCHGLSLMVDKSNIVPQAAEMTHTPAATL